MDLNELVNKGKLRCDNIISAVLIISIIFLFIYFRLFLIMSLIIYPLSSLFIYGLYYFYRLFTKKDRAIIMKVLKTILGIFYMLFSAFMFWLIFSYPQVTLSYVVFFISIPVLLIGLAAILKGSIVKVYSPFYRKLNVLIGCATLVITFLAICFVELNFVLSLASLILLLALNGIMRSGLYLSEFGLSLRKFKNLKYVFFIMDNLIILNLEEDFKL